MSKYDNKPLPSEIFNGGKRKGKTDSTLAIQGSKKPISFAGVLFFFLLLVVIVVFLATIVKNFAVIGGAILTLLIIIGLCAWYVFTDVSPAWMGVLVSFSNPVRFVGSGWKFPIKPFQYTVLSS